VPLPVGCASTLPRKALVIQLNALQQINKITVSDITILSGILRLVEI